MADTDQAPIIMIEFGVRSVLNFIGAATLIMGVWYTDRTWDEKGSQAYYRIQKAGNSNNEEAEFSSSDQPKVVIPKEDLDAAFPFPWAFLLGWFLCGLSHLFQKNELVATAPAILSLVSAVLLSIIASVPMGDAVRNRLAVKKKMLSLLFLICWILYAVFTGFRENSFKLRNGGLPLAFCLIGAFTVIFSMKLLWKYRKMGTSWEENAMPNENPVVYNAGGPLFVMGFFLFWIGMAQTDNLDGDAYFMKNCHNENCGMPIFLNVRTLLALGAGCGMVPAVMFLDCAHDNGNEFTGCGTDGTSFGKFLESPTLFVLHWTLFGLCGFIDTHNNFSLYNAPRSWVVFVLCVLQGIVAGILIQGALYRRNLAGKKKWSKPFVLLFILVAINLGFTPDYSGIDAHGLNFVLCFFGMVFIIMGQKTVFGDRIRGDYWMANDEPNPNPIVYSAGEPLFMFGWILISIGMSYDY